jgi:hypothetical protein
LPKTEFIVQFARARCTLCRQGATLQEVASEQ